MIKVKIIFPPLPNSIAQCHVTHLVFRLTKWTTSCGYNHVRNYTTTLHAPCWYQASTPYKQGYYVNYTSAAIRMFVLSVKSAGKSNHSSSVSHRISVDSCTDGTVWHVLRLFQLAVRAFKGDFMYNFKPFERFCWDEVHFVEQLVPLFLGLGW